MSFNVSTRLNNIQNQINEIVNSGLTNPLQGPLDVNSKLLNNVNIIDGGPNSVQIRTSNAGGIILDNPLYTTGDITVNTLHYTNLDPPINYNAVSYNLIGVHTVEPTEGNINMFNDNPNSGFISVQSLSAPSLSLTISLGAGNNIMYIGFSSSSTETTPSYGVYINPDEGAIQNITTLVSIASTTLIFNLDMLVSGTTMRVFINGIEQPTLSSTIPNVPYYLNCNCYANILPSGYPSEIQAQNINYQISKIENLSDVLRVGNDGGNQDITGIDNLTCNTLSYTTLSPPIPPSQWVGTATSDLNMGGYLISNLSEIDLVGAQSSTIAFGIDPLIPQYLRYTTGQWVENGQINYGNIYDSKYNQPPTPTLLQVLVAGNSGGNNSITSINDIGTVSIHASGAITTNQLFANTVIYPYGSAGSNYQMWATGDVLLIQQYKGTPTPVLTNQPLIINDNQIITLNTANLILKDSYILDSKYNTPSYKRLINNQIFSITSFLNLYGSFFNTPLYPKTVNPSYANGLNYADLTSSYIQVNLTSRTSLSSSDSLTVFLSTSPSNAYNPALGNAITQSAVNGASNITFVSSATSFLYYYSQSPITILYLNIRITSTLQPLSFGATATIIGMLSGSVCSDASPLTYEE